ncbi:MAG: hypothetical protein WCL02_03105 [bacterium]
MMHFLLYGTTWFWITILISIICIIRLVEFNDDDDDTHNYWAGMIIVLTMVLLAIFGNWESTKKIFLFIQDNPFTIFGEVLLYIIIGIIWSFFKWYMYLKPIRDCFRKQEKVEKDEIPKFDNNISQVICWMMYWPFSALWTLTHNLFKDIYKFLAEKLKGLYESMINRMFKEFQENEKTKKGR